MKSRLIVVDISAFIFRAYYAIRPLSSEDGTPVNAVYGVTNMLLKLMSKYQPSHIIIAQDVKEGSFRREIYPEYKANRSEAPEDLKPQFKIIDDLLIKMKLHCVRKPGFEADDVIGSVVTQFKNDFDEIFIASGDKDLMQFVDGPVKMLDTMKDILYGRDEVFEKMGVYPEQIIDYLSLLGDASDNIPGVKGIGAKGASKLLAEYENLDNIFENIDKITNKRALNGLTNHRDDAEMSKKLITIVTDIELSQNISDYSYELRPDQELKEFFTYLGFKNTIAKLAEYEEIDGQIEKEEIIFSEISLKEIAKIKSDKMSLEMFNMSYDYHDDQFIFASLCDGESQYVIELKNDDYLKLFKVLETKSLVSSNAKEILYHSENKDMNIFDISNAHFIVNPSSKHNLESISLELTNFQIKDLNVFRKNKDEMNREEVMEQMSLRARVTFESEAKIKEYLIEHELENIYENIDSQLVPILSGMEKQGVLFDADFYAKKAKEFEKELEGIKTEIYKIADTDINLKSPKQVSVLLFEKLELPVIKKTKTGASTNSDVLNQLDQMGVSEVPGLILKYRELDKLLSTYLNAFPKLVNKETSRIHTHFVLNNAQTGRLSSDTPNLQNIPIKTENGRALRKGFVAPKGHVLLAADYSQIELRILAHFSKDETMVDAFKNDRDIHSETASEVFEVELDEVTREERGAAKAINFGLMYGQSSFGLSQTLNIPMGEAKEHITNYFMKFGSIKSYLDSLKESCEKYGYSITMFGRKRFIPDIKSSNRMTKSNAERVAINSPIQGTAADILKMAMIAIDSELKKKKLKTKMILQVHDELIFEVPENEQDEIEAIVRKNMEEVVKLKVPLKVDIGIGKNWYLLK